MLLQTLKKIYRKICQCHIAFLAGNQKTISKALLYPNIREYRYWDAANRCLDIEGMLEDLRVSRHSLVWDHFEMIF